MEEGRRLENLSWRIWNRETFCCEPQPQLATTPAIETQRLRPNAKSIPELSSSVESVASDETERTEDEQRSRALPVDIKRPSQSRESAGSHISSRGSQKHITSAGLEKMVISIKEKKELQPLSPSIAEAVPMFFPSEKAISTSDSQEGSQRASQSSSSDVASTAPLSSPDSARHALQTVGSDTSAELHTSHSVVRGFSPGHISSSYRSCTRLAPAPIPVKSSLHAKTEESKSKSGMFLLGGSSGEDDSSFDEHISTKPPQSSLIAAQLRPVGEKKQTSFKDEVESRTINQRSHEDEVFESDDEEDVSESAIEEEDESDWESSSSESGGSVPNDKPMFERVFRKPNLVSRPSLLTTLMHQPERAAALAEMASRSQSVLHRSRTSSPNGPSVAASPDDDEDSMLSLRNRDPRSKPIIMTTSNIHPPPLSPRTTRRNMLATELTESLRKHLLWERQQKNTTANAVLKRRHTAQDVANIQKYPSATGSGSTSRNNSWNHYFDHGLGEYHQKGW